MDMREILSHLNSLFHHQKYPFSSTEVKNQTAPYLDLYDDIIPLQMLNSTIPHIMKYM